MLVRLFWTTHVKASKNVYQELITKKKKNGETETKRVLNSMRMPKLSEILTTVATFCHHYVRLVILKNVFAIILLCASEGVENLSKQDA